MREMLSWLVCVSVVLLWCATEAWGQCEPTWESWGAPTGMNARVNSLTIWDPDGDGPLPAQLVAGGSFTTAGGETLNRIARWDGTQWRPFGSGMNNPVQSLTTWDPDGDGPLPAQLVAGGSFTTAGGVTVNRIARWDGTQWLPFGSGMNDTVQSLTTWDPDGDGPLPPQLVAGGSFTTAGGVTVNGIARWDGTQWLPFGSGMDGAFGGTVQCLTTWDPDGDGPLPPQLVAGGFFTTAGGVTVYNIARWDGTQWRPFVSGTDGLVYALSTWDPDGDGPLPPQLVAGGSFTTAGGVTVNRIARWDGTQWQPFGSGMNTAVRFLTTWDPDGDGPLPPQLVAGGSFVTAGGVTVNYFARWDATQWLPFGSGMGNSVLSATTWDPDGDGPLPAQLVAGGEFITAGGGLVNRIARWDGTQWLPFGSGMSSSVLSLTTWDPDGDGPLPPQLVAGGLFPTAGGMRVNAIARWDDTQWLWFGSGMNNTVSSLTTWDPDGDGPLPAQLVAGGWFTAAGGVTVNRIARWDGTQWLPFGSGMNNPVQSLTTWDPDGSGPLPAQLVAGGLFTAAGGVTVNRIARWDGTQWLPFGSGMNNPVQSLTTWDPDGSGPLPAQLVAGGLFTAAGGVTVNRIARWDGTQWLPFGSGMNNSVFSLTTWDPDGDGPLPPQLVAGGFFTTAGGVTVNYIARWDGTQWLPFGSGMNGQVNTLTTWDPDGDGPLPPQLVAGGTFTTASGVTVNRIARWDGTQWLPFGSGMDNTVQTLTTWDPDGDGPLPAQLVAGGDFATAGGVTVNRIARWDGTQWRPFGSGMDNWVYSLTTWDPDGDGPLPTQLVASGEFTNAGGQPAGHLAMWSLGVAPTVTLQPAGVSVSPGDTITLIVSALNGRPSVQWHRNGTPILNGPGGASPDGGVVLGATATLPFIGTTATLTITNAQPGDSGQYTAVFTNACGSTTSSVAIVSVTGSTPACNPADIAATDASPGPDGQVDNGDFLLFVASFFTADCDGAAIPCNPADIAQTDAAPGPDGQVDNGDFLLFIASFFAGC